MQYNFLNNLTSDDKKALYLLCGFFIVIIGVGELIKLPHTTIGEEQALMYEQTQASVIKSNSIHNESIALIADTDFINTGVSNSDTYQKISDESLSGSNIVEEKRVIDKAVNHILTPEKVRALYITKWFASAPRLRGRVVKKIDESPVLNAIVIDIKDDTGRISFDLPATTKKEIGGNGASENVVRDMKKFIKELHAKNIYVIGRVSVFQDAYFPKINPEYGIKDKTGKLWGDRKKQRWVDQSSKEYWKYIATIAEQSYNIGFDEINFDYIRFPTDGKMDSMVYPFYDGMKPKHKIIEEFYAYLHHYFKPKGIPISGDLFGLTTEVSDDMGIGQKMEYALKYFDFVGPMIYPSHYPSGYRGIKDPAKNPYKVIRAATEGAIIKAVFDPTLIKKLRPWVQDFNMGGKYGVAEIHAQIRAMAELGINSYMVWDPKNKYTDGAFDDEVDYVLRDFKKPDPKQKKEIVKKNKKKSKVKEKELSEIISKTNMNAHNLAQ